MVFSKLKNCPGGWLDEKFLSPGTVHRDENIF
jgi:hypothetical protein